MKRKIGVKVTPTGSKLKFKVDPEQKVVKKSGQKSAKNPRAADISGSKLGSKSGYTLLAS